MREGEREGPIVAVKQADADDPWGLLRTSQWTLGIATSGPAVRPVYYWRPPRLTMGGMVNVEKGGLGGVELHPWGSNQQPLTMYIAL